MSSKFGDCIADAAYTAYWVNRQTGDEPGFSDRLPLNDMEYLVLLSNRDGVLAAWVLSWRK